MFTWLQNHHRAALRAAPFPEEWRDFLRRHVAQYDWLNPAEQKRLQDDLRIFVAEKQWEGARGFVVSDEVKVVIAAQVCFLLLGWAEPHYFPNVSTIIVYPAGFQAKTRRREGYLETEKQHNVLGEAWSGNLPVIVSWDDARSGGEDPEDGHNVLLHEFAHKLDMLEGGADGVPPLRGGDADYDDWARVMSEEFRGLRRTVWEGKDSAMDNYGAENEAEFFAVATETFFEKPHRLCDEHPELYGILKSYYGQDTAARWEEWHSNKTNAPSTDNSPVASVIFPAYFTDYIPEDSPHGSA